jgi:hypothetical protein
MASPGQASLAEGLLRGFGMVQQYKQGQRADKSRDIIDQMNLMKLGEAQKEIDERAQLGQEITGAQARGDFTATPAGPLTAETAVMPGTTFLGDAALPTGTLTESTPAMPAKTTHLDIAKDFYANRGKYEKVLEISKAQEEQMGRAAKAIHDLVVADPTRLLLKSSEGALKKTFSFLAGTDLSKIAVDTDEGVVSQDIPGVGTAVWSKKKGHSFQVIQPKAPAATPQPTEMGARVAAALKPGGPEDIALTRKQQEELDKEKGKATTSANKEAERDARTKKEDQLKAATADWKLKTQRIKEYSTKKSKAEAVRQKAWDAKDKDAQAVAETNFKETMKGLYEDYADLWPSDEGAPTPAKAAQPPAKTSVTPTPINAPLKSNSGKDYWIWPDGKAYYEPPKG